MLLLLQGLMALQALSPASVQEAHQHFSEAQSQLRSAQQQQQQQQQQTASASAPDPVLDALNPTPGIKQDLGIRQGLGSDAAPALDSRPEDLNLTPQIQVHQELGFDASINWSMLGPAPPRTVPHVSSTEAWAHTEQLLQDLLGTFDVLQVRSSLISCSSGLASCRLSCCLGKAARCWHHAMHDTCPLNWHWLMIC